MLQAFSGIRNQGHRRVWRSRSLKNTILRKQKVGCAKDALFNEDTCCRASCMNGIFYSAAGWRLRQPGCLSHSQWSKRPVDIYKHQVQALALIRGATVFVYTNSVFREPAIMQGGRQTRAYAERMARLCTWRDLSFEARLHHRSQDAHEVLILKSGRNTFLVGQLLINLLCLTMGIFLYLHLHPITWG